MSERKIDRDAWADLVAALVQTETKGKKAPFARRAGVDPRTLDRWLKSEVDVSEGSVRGVARALGRSPLDLLVAVGYYRHSEIEAQRPQDDRDEEMEIILTADVPDETKRRMIEILVEQRERDKQRRIEDIRWRLERGA